MSEKTPTNAPAAGTKKNHHFVPQMYLRAFADPASQQGELWRHGPGFKPQPKSPKGVAWQDYFYDLAGERLDGKLRTAHGQRTRPRS